MDTKNKMVRIKLINNRASGEYTGHELVFNIQDTLCVEDCGAFSSEYPEKSKLYLRGLSDPFWVRTKDLKELYKK